MAVAVEALPAAAEAAEGTAGAGEAAATSSAATSAPRRRQGSSSGDYLNTARSAYGRVSTPDAALGTITKLVWAAVIAFVVLAIAAEATGRTWSFSLPNRAATPAPKQPYAPLYHGQAQNPLAFTGTTESPLLPLSGRAGGNQALA